MNATLYDQTNGFTEIVVTDIGANTVPDYLDAEGYEPHYQEDGATNYPFDNGARVYTTKSGQTPTHHAVVERRDSGGFDLIFVDTQQNLIALRFLIAPWVALVKAN